MPPRPPNPGSSLPWYSCQVMLSCIKLAIKIVHCEQLPHNHRPRVLPSKKPSFWPDTELPRYSSPHQWARLNKHDSLEHHPTTQQAACSMEMASTQEAISHANKTLVASSLQERGGFGFMLSPDPPPLSGLCC